MKRIMLVLSGIVLVATAVTAQGPVFVQSDLWTLPYEDLSDIIRKYPGMYPLDYGTLGAPLLFRPFHMNPWELQVERDLIPQNRRSDGLFDPNLQPGSELDTIRYHYLAGRGGGLFHLDTRSMPVDTPYSEFQIREGFYGYGTVDFAHGQRMYRSSTLELSGRLAWYNGLRPQTAARFNRLRGRVGFNLGKRYRIAATYAGSNVNTDFPLHPSGQYSEREEAILQVDEQDSLRTNLDPAVRLYIRQDRENWGPGFHLREGLGGWIAQVHAIAPHQRFTVRHSGSYAQIDYPGAPELYETTTNLFAQDSVFTAHVGLRAFGRIQGEIVSNDPTDTGWNALPSGGLDLTVNVNDKVDVRGGYQYEKELWPIAWSEGRYLIGDRPLRISPEFLNQQRWFVGGERGKDTYGKSLVGLKLTLAGADIEVNATEIRQYGSLRTVFSVQDTVVTTIASRTNMDPIYEASAVLQIPLVYGLRIDSWSAAQFTRTGERDETRMYSRIYFEHRYFDTPLIIRSHISHEYIGLRTAYTESGQVELPAANIVGFRLSATIQGVTLIWGTENFFKQHYEILPGYRMISKEEYIGVIWKLWL
jgi:hypothetical protein